jgi:hypothetical protein
MMEHDGAAVFYLEVIRFESRPGFRLYWLRFSPFVPESPQVHGTALFSSRPQASNCRSWEKIFSQENRPIGLRIKYLNSRTRRSAKFSGATFYDLWLIDTTALTCITFLSPSLRMRKVRYLSQHNDKVKDGRSGLDSRQGHWISSSSRRPDRLWNASSPLLSSVYRTNLGGGKMPGTWSWTLMSI